MGEACFDAMEPLRLLIVEDSESDAALVLLALQCLDRSIEFERVETAAAMREALEQGPWDVVLSDWSMPTFSAPAALALLQELQIDLPFIIVSGTIGEEVAVDAMRAGAHDYVQKDKLGRLAPAIEREIRQQQTRQAHRRAEVARGEAELRFRRLCESRIAGVSVSHTSGTITEANDTFLEMVGYTSEDVRAGAVNWVEMTPVEWRAPSLSAREDLRVGGVARPLEKEYVRKDGTRIPVLVGVARLDESRFLTIVTDLTDRKRAEQAKMALEEQL